MATVNSYSIQLLTSLLASGSTFVSNPGDSATTGDVVEAFGGLPQRIAAGAADVNIKLGTLTNPLWLAVFGAEGVTFKIANGGTALDASPFGFVADIQNGLGISEIWVSNSHSAQQTVTIMAAE